MPFTPRVFISHSAKELEAAELCQALARHFKQGFEVYWDKQLETSQSWRAAIDEWLWRCDAAVLVLSDSATQSRYVAYEVALLRQRWRYGLPLVPIWCPGVTEQTLVERMGALQVAEIQTNLKMTSWPTDFNSVAKQTQDILSPLINCSRPRHELEEKLIEDLDFGTSTENRLRAVADKYALSQPITGAKKELAVLLARHLIDCAAPLGEKRFSNLAVGLGTMRTAMSEASVRVPRIVNLVAPFCWVRPEGAIQVASLFSLPAGIPRAVGWCRSWKHAEKMYLYRGFCTHDPTRLYIVKISDVTGGDTSAILEHIRGSLAYAVCRQRSAMTQRVADRIKSLANAGKPVFLIVPAKGVDSEVVDAVLDTYQQICVFLYAEEDDPINLKQQFPRVMLLDPPLVPAEEESALMGWGDCMSVADPKADLEADSTFL